MSQPGQQHHPLETTLRRLKTVKDEQHPEHTWLRAIPVWSLTQTNSQASSVKHVTGWVQRFLTNCRRPMNLQRKDRILLPTEISEAETFWIKQAQAQAFPGGENEGSLTQPNPKSDGNGLLQTDGRLRFADELPYDTRYTILLWKDHPVTRLVIIDAHERLCLRAGVEQVLTELRRHSWIVKGRLVVRSVHRVQQLLGQFWKRWRKEFLPSLNARKKWFHPRHNLKEGDVVLIVEPNASRGEWHLGRVIEAYPGDDGLVRVMKVKAKNKEYLRPVHHLCPLEYVEDSAEEWE